MEAKDLEGLSDAKLQFVVDHGDPNGQLYPLAQQILESRKPKPASAPQKSFLQKAGDAVAGVAGGLYESIPGLAPGLEAVGELSDTLVPGQNPKYNLFPRPGQIDRAVQESPQGAIASRTLGGLAVPLGAAGMLGKATEAGARVALAPVSAAYRGLAGQAPGALRTVAAGAGTGAMMGAGEAAIRRAPAAVAEVANAAGANLPDNAQPISPSEIVLPAVLGGAMSLAPGISAWATNPKTRVGVLANRYAQDRASGAYQTGELADLPKGKLGMDTAKELGRERIAEAKTQAQQSFEDRLPALEQPVRTQEREAKAGLARELEDAQGIHEMAKGQAASVVEPRIRAKLQAQREAAGNDLSAVLDQLDKEGVRISSDGFMRKLRGIVSKSARSDTANTEDEIHTPYGQTLANIERMANQYLQDGGTVADWRNFLKYVKASAESGTPEKTFPFKEIVGAVRDHMAAQEPRIGEASARYRKATTDQERVSGILYRQNDLNALGKQAAHTKLDVPEAGDPFSPESLTPGEEAAGRQRLIQLGDRSAAAAVRLPERQELIDKGYEPEVLDMENRLAKVADQQHATERQHAEAVAKVEADVQRQLLEIKRQLREETNAPVEEAKTNASELEKSKLAQEESRLPGFSKLSHSLLIGGLGLTSHTPAHGAALAGLGAEGIRGAFAQPIASRAAYYLPEAGTMRANMPGFMGLVTAKDQAQDVVKKAREHTRRFGATIQERLRAKKED